MAKRLRLDAELVRRGLARSREHASELIGAGRVSISGAVAHKPATGVTTDAAIVVREDQDEPGYASRGGYKLAGALDVFEADQLILEGRTALDAGASTGGFTDVLLRRGVAQVIAVDVGYGQLAWALQQDPRVTVLDRTNVRELTVDVLPARPDLVEADLSFISLGLVLPALEAITHADADLVLMVKPQFEVGKERLGKGGVVRDPELRADAIRSVAADARTVGFGVRGLVASPLPGPAGNVEYFLWLRRDADDLHPDDAARVVDEGPG
jgi:23S rRNA (cytidine1920-2'-O)/16S rRNA (cytidine1409-2'-O)-methyltransferase